MTENMATTSASSSKKRKTNEIESADDASLPTQRNARVVEIIPDADVTLQAGDGKDAVDIKASGVVLSLASSVFKVMLGSAFIEGSTKVVNLSKDDPQLIIDFCHIIHYQYDSVKALDGKRIRGLILIADMRDCRAPLKGWLSAVLAEHTEWFARTTSTFASFISEATEFPTSIPGLVIEDIIAFAYVFDMQTLFSDATYIYLARAGESFLPLLPKEENYEETFPPMESHGIRIQELLVRVRSSRMQHLSKTVFSCIWDELDTTSGNTALAAKDRICKSSQQKYGAFVYWLSLGGLVSAGFPSYSRSWMDMLKHVAKVAGDADFPSASQEEKAIMQASGIERTSNCRNIYCQYCSRDVRRALRDVVDKSYNEDRAPACLKCFKESGKFCDWNTCKKR